MNFLVEFLSREKLPVRALERWYFEHVDATPIADDAISAMGQLDAAIAWRAVWMLRRVNRDKKLRPDQLARICEEAPGVNHWAWRLCLCQLLARTGCPASSREVLFPFLEKCYADRRPMVRAWALSAMLHFKTESAFRSRVVKALQKAQKDPGKSVQARLRQLARI